MTVQMIPRIQGQKGSLTTKRYCRVGEVAVHFAVSTQTVYRMIDMGDLKAIRLRFDRTPKGVILLDQIGTAQGQ